jgi:hypothetical protein
MQQCFRMTASGWHKGLLVLGTASVLLALGGLDRGRPAPQAAANLLASTSPSLVQAVADYPKSWPPLYPALLWTSARMGLGAGSLNLIFLLAELALLWRWLCQRIPHVNPTPVVAVVALMPALHFTLYRAFAETLFTLLAVAFLFLGDRFARTPSTAVAAIMGLVCAAACMTRFFGIFWLLPIGLLQVSGMVGGEHRKGRLPLRNVMGFLVGPGLILMPWLLLVAAQTGNLSGSDRFASRAMPAGLEHWGDLGRPLPTLVLTVETLAIDLFSPVRIATHRHLEWGPRRLEVFIWSAVASLSVWGLVAIGRSRNHWVRTPALAHNLPLLFGAWYVMVVLLLWSATNNDPVYTRFLSPAYAFLVCGAVLAWSRVGGCLGPRDRVPFRLIALVFVGSNLVKLVLAVVGRSIR